MVATANEGYTFAGWSENGNLASTNASYTFNASANRTLLANFTLKQYTISLSANPVAGGTVSGGGTSSHGQSVTVVATANEGYTFVGWSENGDTVSNNPSYTLSATADHTLVANFTLNRYDVSLSANPTAGGTVSGAGTFNHGQSVTIVADPNGSYGFAGWSENGSVVSLNAIYTFTVSSARNLVANFVQTPVAVNDAAGTSATSSVRIHVLANDIDPAASGLKIVELTQPGHGSAIINLLGSESEESIVYTPAASFSGQDSFTYTVQDKHGFRSLAVVSVIVTNPAEGKAAPEVKVIDNGSENVLNLNGVKLTLPTGAYSGTLAVNDVFYIVFTEVITPGAHVAVSPGANYQYAGRSFILQAYLNKQLLADYAFPKELTLSVSYDPARMSGLDEKTTLLYYWNEATGAWSESGLTRLAIDITAHTISYRVAHFTEFALFAVKAETPASESTLWLPFITK